MTLLKCREPSQIKKLYIYITKQTKQTLALKKGPKIQSRSSAKAHRMDGWVWGVWRISGGKCSRFKQGSESFGGANSKVSWKPWRTVNMCQFYWVKLWCNVETQFLVPATFLKTQDLEKTTQKWQVEIWHVKISTESHPKSLLIDGSSGYALPKLKKTCAAGL